MTYIELYVMCSFTCQMFISVNTAKANQITFYFIALLGWLNDEVKLYAVRFEFVNLYERIQIILTEVLLGSQTC